MLTAGKAKVGRKQGLPTVDWAAGCGLDWTVDWRVDCSVGCGKDMVRRADAEYEWKWTLGPFLILRPPFGVSILSRCGDRRKKGEESGFAEG